ncbi:hypothetical protein MUK70_25240 [Dyadobacter chenwenxiniae]|uniref:Aldose 1-epimerase n=1 Tax=Dyadobacter chenwenxiniae TaxID=2906456 RepID=A0A9X1THG6_9BACT|nr:hypothetical protein [Dyadobacter chenwenxiniae]MCF0064464.1 hypothetical protein [Dyadobacter chenwenxiniae]UON82333.1 hypothetical protein MUK70_25240 [Dyadobacter chenwenxiniae]
MKRITLLFALICLAISAFRVIDFPQAEISNGVINAKLFLPDSANGYYRGVRFDWAGQVPTLEYKGHSYFGQWNSTYDPKLHDAIMGPVEEFVALDFDKAKAGGTFVKIGVGVLVKPDDKKYSFATNYEIKDGGKWTVDKKKDQVTFTHTLKDPTGYGYVYTKTLKLVKGKPQLVLEHSLKNTGSKDIATSTYNHNFFMIDKEPTNENIRIVFPFTVSGEGAGFGTIINAKEKTLTYARPVVPGDQVFSSGLKGFGPNAKDYDIRIENIKTSAGVRITGDRPLEKLVYWANPTTSCPEPYIHISAKPGQETKWNVNYEFYTF